MQRGVAETAGAVDDDAMLVGRRITDAATSTAPAYLKELFRSLERRFVAETRRGRPLSGDDISGRLAGRGSTTVPMTGAAPRGSSSTPRGLVAAMRG